MNNNDPRPDQVAQVGRYTTPSEPPSKRQKSRFSKWEELFEECRDDVGVWRRVNVAMTKSTATQLASDIRNAHSRTATKARLRGLRTDERWDAQWGEADGNHYIWLCHLGRGEPAA